MCSSRLRCRSCTDLVNPMRPLPPWITQLTKSLGEGQDAPRVSDSPDFPTACAARVRPLTTPVRLALRLRESSGRWRSARRAGLSRCAARKLLPRCAPFARLRARHYGVPSPPSPRAGDAVATAELLCGCCATPPTRRDAVGRAEHLLAPSATRAAAPSLGDAAPLREGAERAGAPHSAPPRLWTCRSSCRGHRLTAARCSASFRHARSAHRARLAQSHRSRNAACSSSTERPCAPTPGGNRRTKIYGITASRTGRATRRRARVSRARRATCGGGAGAAGFRLRRGLVTTRTSLRSRRRQTTARRRAPSRPPERALRRQCGEYGTDDTNERTSATLPTTIRCTMRPPRPSRERGSSPE